MFRNFKTHEMNWQDGAQQIDDCQYLFATSISEIGELTLGLVIAEAKAQDRAHIPMNDSELEILKANAKPIEPDPTCRVFEVLFDRSHMVSYTVLNESYGVYPREPEKFVGKFFRKFSWSHLLEFTKQTTIASEFYPGPLEHYQIACLNHVVDVIATAPPRIAMGLLKRE
jgi:hypothetical protein